MADKTAYRREYNALKTRQRQEQSDALRRFAAANPERYAELMEQARHSVAQELTTSPRPAGRSIGEIIDASRLRETEHWVDKYLRERYATRRDWTIRAKDAWGDKHTLFLGFPRSHTPQPGDKVKTPVKGAEYTVIEATPCTCPLCT